MDTRLIIQAWKDPAFRARLSPEQRAALPESPSGRSLTEIDDEELGDIIGGREPKDLATTGCVGPYRPTCGIVLCDIRVPPAER